MKKRTPFLVVLLVVMGMHLSARADESQLVLVSLTGNIEEPFTPLEVRQLFLGVPVYRDDKRISPVLNRSSRLVYEVFLQKSMFLSARSYEQQLVRRVFQLGGTRPQEIESIEDLKPTLSELDNAVAYMWADDLANQDDLHVIQVLWSGNLQ